MKQSISKLRNIFAIEADRDYPNKAVIGGIDRILGTWEQEARDDQIPDELIELVINRLRDYGRLSPASRAELLEGLWRRVQRSEGGQSTIPPFTKSRPAKKPVAQRKEPPKTKQQRTPGQPGKTAEPADTEISASPLGELSVSAVRAMSNMASDEIEDAQLSPVAPPPSHHPAPSIQTLGPEALNKPLTVVSGIGEKLAGALSQLGMFTLRDMLYHFPRRYLDYSKLEPINRLWYGKECTVIGTLQSVRERKLSGDRTLVEAVLSDGTGELRVTWWNNRYIARRYPIHSHVTLAGKVGQYLGRLVMNSPEIEAVEQQNLTTNRIVPVYPLTGNISQRWLRKTIIKAAGQWAPRLCDPLQGDLRRSAGLVELSRALYQVHCPDSQADLEAARQRLAFDEVFYLQLGVQKQKRAWQSRDARVFAVEKEELEQQIQNLPFALTNAQLKAIEDIRQDFASGHPMNRLIQGDVGSGKTIVAAMGIFMVARHKSQSAVMAPTSILAEQHYKNLLRTLAEKKPADENAEALSEQSTPPVLHPEEIRLLIGATPEAEKEEIRAGLASGAIKLVIGTHALIESPIEFADLQLVVIDEQHRFGVEQRALLREKGANPHLLVMTATPIPRSLALTIYGDLDLTVLDEMPPGRQPVGTYVLEPRERERVYSLIRSQVALGRQAFIICPLVEETGESDESKAAIEEHARLQSEVFPDLKLALLHGRMRPDDKDEVMNAFRNREYDILVSTSVIEVGVDVPNATVMLIEGANRFGLSQLHQFRGRVGRGADKSYCVLIPESADGVENERLQVMASTNDGFVLAEKDLEQRGPGQFLGARQSGFGEFKLANFTNVRLIEKARRIAQELFERDPELEQPENRSLRNSLEMFWLQAKGEVS